MATITMTENRHERPRFRSLSLKVSNSPLYFLPTEILLLILEHAILYCKPSDLALVSSVFRRVLDVILYRTVVLDSTETLQLFHRTAQSKGPTFLADHVLSIVVTDHDVVLHCYLSDIIATCFSLRSFDIPSYRWHQRFLTENPDCEKSLESTTLRSFGLSNITNRRSPRLPAMEFSNLTHLRISEPADVWCSPSDMVEAFGPLPHLSHLQLARRANANRENDEKFALSISSLLASRPALKILVISVFPGAFLTSGDAPVQNSDIWHRMREICCSDQRLILAPGRYEEWKDRWSEIRAIRSGWHPIDYYWLCARSTSNAL